LSEKALKDFKQTLDEQNQKIMEFDSILSQLDSLESKKKLLWMHIYKHAMEDRTNAYMLFVELYVMCKNTPADHNLNGPLLSKYIERMSKANDQILKLAELIENAQHGGDDKPITESEIYNTIKGA
jgi:hypothetical protein